MKGGNLLIIIGILIASEISKFTRKPQKGGAYAEIGLFLLLVAIIGAVVLIVTHGVAEKKKEAEKKKKEAEKKKKDAEKKKKDAEKKKKDAGDNTYCTASPTAPSPSRPVCCQGDTNKDGKTDVKDLLAVLSEFGITCDSLKKDSPTSTQKKDLMKCIESDIADGHNASSRGKVNVEDLLLILSNYGAVRSPPDSPYCNKN